jgi:hypothetical protein
VKDKKEMDHRQLWYILIAMCLVGSVTPAIDRGLSNGSKKWLGQKKEEAGG